MAVPSLFRRRFIPNELIHLKDDTILSLDKDHIATKWNSLHPRSDIARGISMYFLEKGFKISKIFDKDDHLVYWYFDIIQAKYGPYPTIFPDLPSITDKNTVIIEDLLLDVILYEDGTVHVRDIDELCETLEKGLITQAEATYALRILDSLLKIIYSGNVNALQELVDQFDEHSPSSSI